MPRVRRPGAPLIHEVKSCDECPANGCGERCLHPQRSRAAGYLEWLTPATDGVMADSCPLRLCGLTLEAGREVLIEEFAKDVEEALVRARADTEGPPGFGPGLTEALDVVNDEQECGGFVDGPL